MIQKTVIGAGVEWVWGEGHWFQQGPLHQHNHLIDELRWVIGGSEEKRLQGRIGEMIRKTGLGGLGCLVGGSEEKRLQGRTGEMIQKTVIGWVWGKGHQFGQRPLHQHNHLIDELRWVIGGSEEKRLQRRIGEMIRKTVIGAEVEWVWGEGHWFQQGPLHQHNHLIDELRWVIGGSEEKRLQRRIGEMIRKTVIGAEVEWVIGGSEEKRLQGRIGEMIQKTVIGGLGCLVGGSEERIGEIRKTVIGAEVEWVWGEGHWFQQGPLPQHNHLIEELRWVIGGSEEKRLQRRIGEMIRKTVVGWVWGKGHQFDQRPLHQHNHLIDELGWVIGGGEKRLQGRIGEVIQQGKIGKDEVGWV